MLAEVVLVFHFAIVVFIITGVPLMLVGAWRHWAWVRGWYWRVLHLMAILFVAAESLLGIACPLTVWEDVLRGYRPRRGFLERWIEGLMFFNLPSWVFTLLYTAYAILVAVMWVAIPANSRPHPHSVRASVPRR
jgi:hypothetical protein